MTTSPWTFAEESQAIPAGHVTLVRGTTFAILDPAGDLTSQGVQGLFVADTRVCSRAQLIIDAGSIEPLAVTQLEPGTAAFGGRSADHSLFVRRTWTLGSGARCDIELFARMRTSRWVDVGLGVGSDLADLFSVKDGRPARIGQATVRSSGAEEVRIDDVEGHRGVVARVLDIGRAEPLESEDGFAWRAMLDDEGRWRCSIELSGTRAGVEVAPSPARTWTPAPHRTRVSVDTDVPGLARAVERSIEDLDALRLVDPQFPDDEVVAAGAPWFMTLFGRDSLLTSWMALPVDPALGLATARTLARLQGRRVDAATEEQPGRILHEVRFGAGPSLSLGESERYYATADATPLFVMLVHELWRWGTSWPDIAALLPAVHAAVEWMSGPGDLDGDGFIEYERATEHGLRNQGWKDSWDAISSIDGTLANPPIALAEVQAYAYAALHAAGELSAAAGDHVRAGRYSERADRLRQAFDEAFWLPERHWYALALDADKRPVDALASNLGHLLWSGVVPPERVGPVAEALVSEPMRNGWGIRTLASTMDRYDPLGYHTGSVWPHDTAIAVAGLRRAGRPADATALATAVLEAADAMGGRLPELFAGLSRDEFPAPVPYPASCSPQAWASAAPLLLLRSLLGLEVDVPGNRICLDPQLPEGCRRLCIAGLCLAGNDVTIQVDGETVAFHGLPHGLAVELA